MNHNLQRYDRNPILVPNKEGWWESEAVFNPAVFYDGDKVHMLYRAIGKQDNYISRIGYAYSTDGFSFERQKEIAISPVEDYEQYGIEDPRLIGIGNQVFITYVVLSDYVSKGPIGSTALAVTTDFKDYTRLGIITSKGSDTKDVALFPEKINDKYLFLHRPNGWVGQKFGVAKPSIWLGEGRALTSFEKHTILLQPKYEWEDSKIGSGPPPIKTKKGWLLCSSRLPSSPSRPPRSWRTSARELRRCAARLRRARPPGSLGPTGGTTTSITPPGCGRLGTRRSPVWSRPRHRCPRGRPRRAGDPRPSARSRRSGSAAQPDRAPPLPASRRAGRPVPRTGLGGLRAESARPAGESGRPPCRSSIPLLRRSPSAAACRRPRWSFARCSSTRTAPSSTSPPSIRPSWSRRTLPRSMNSIAAIASTYSASTMASLHGYTAADPVRVEPAQTNGLEVGCHKVLYVVSAVPSRSTAASASSSGATCSTFLPRSITHAPSRACRSCPSAFAQTSTAAASPSPRSRNSIAPTASAAFRRRRRRS